MTRQLFIAGLLNAAALSALFIGSVSIGWKCQSGHPDAATHAPPEMSPRMRSGRRAENAHANANDNDVAKDRSLAKASSAKNEASAAASASRDGFVPSHLKWKDQAVDVPPDWSFRPPSSSCQFDDQFDGGLGDQKIIVHYHMQHNAGTIFYTHASRFIPCGTRSCWQEHKQCLVSLDEEVEADNLRRNYETHGLQFVSYELMLPPRFPLPFVSYEARRGLFFTTIVRDPMKRLLTFLRRSDLKGRGVDSKSPFWTDLERRQNAYFPADNLNVRWLSGAYGRISDDHLNVAKCRLQLFDLVVVDKLYDHALKSVICPLNDWKGRDVCHGRVPETEHESLSKSDPLRNGTDPLLVGAWIERLRPSFDLYDYARILGWKALKERGAKDLPPLSDAPSYMDTLASYGGFELTHQHYHDRKVKVRRVSLANEEHFAPPPEFCDGMKRIWTSNPDEVPFAAGIGTIMNGFHPIVGGRKSGGKSRQEDTQ
ncbi:hypothetical protein ACHAWF_009952 [Thalassiosira exigua]